MLIHFYLKRVKYFEFIIKTDNDPDNGVEHDDALPPRLLSVEIISTKNPRGVIIKNEPPSLVFVPTPNDRKSDFDLNTKILATISSIPGTSVINDFLEIL